MNIDNYKRALKAAQSEIEEIVETRARLDQRLAQLKGTTDALSALLQQSGTGIQTETFNADGMGITQAIRELMSETRRPMSAPEIKMGLSKRGLEMGGYASPLAVIHNTLKRLERQEEVTPVKNPAGHTVAYALRFVGPGSAERSGMRG